MDVGFVGIGAMGEAMAGHVPTRHRFGARPATVDAPT
jgi:3-hydroxyisobutyrate dehydrogenase-like beta-hydroxyacid dehydrogenase